MAELLYREIRGENLKRLDGLALKCVNVRRDEREPEVWHPAGMPLKLRTDGWKPLFQLALPGSVAGTKVGEAMFWRKDDQLGVGIAPMGELKESDMITLLTARLEAEVLSADIVEPGVIRMLMKHSPAVYLSYDSSGRMFFHGVMPDLPSALFTVVDETTLSEPLESVALTGESNSRNGAMCAEDLRRVSRVLADAYERLKVKAHDAGFLVQPVFARYRLEDGGGDTVCCSATVLASGITGFQCCGSVEMTSTDGLSTLSGGSLTARCYRLRLLAPGTLGAPWRTIVRRLTVELTPEIDPVDRSALCAASVSNNGGTTTVALHLPGVGGSSAYAAARRRVLVAETLATSGGSFRIHDVCNLPFGGMADRTLVLRSNPPAAPKTDGTIRRDAVSHSACCRTPEFTVLANERREGFKGHNADEFMLSAVGSGAWCSEVTVAIDRGNGMQERASTFKEGDANCPKLLSPLLIYPDADAREMTITVSSQGKVRTGKFALTPLPELGIAYYLAPGLEPMELPSEGGEIAGETCAPAASVATGLVSISRHHRQCAPTDRRQCGKGEIAAIMMAPRNRSAWEHAREKVMLYGADGTRVLAIDRMGVMHSLAPLDNRSIRSAKAVAETSGKRGLVHLAIAGGDLVEIDQSGVSTLLRDCGADEVGRCIRHDEIWLAGGGRPLRRVTSGGEVVEACLDGETCDSHLHMLGTRLTVSCGSVLYDPEEETWPEAGVEWQINERYEISTPDEAYVCLFATECAGTVCISGDNGSRVAEKLVEIEVDGAINAPIYVALPGPRRIYMECGLHVTTGPDGEWRGLCSDKKVRTTSRPS